MSLTVFTHVLRLRRYERKYIENWRFHTNAVSLIPNFRYKGSPPPIIFAQLVRPMNALQLCRCSRLSSSEVHFLMKIGRFAFLRPPLGDLGATYDDRLRLIGKRVVDFVLALMELFRYVLRLRRYERLSVENRRFRSNGGRLTKNFR